MKLQAESEAAAAKLPATGQESVQRHNRKKRKRKDYAFQRSEQEPLEAAARSCGTGFNTRQAAYVPWQARAGPPKSTSFTCNITNNNNNNAHSPLRLDEAKKLALLGACDGVQDEGDRQLSHRVNPVGGHEAAAHI